MILPDPIETERLILRLPREGDFDATAAFMASERAQFVSNSPERGEAWKYLLAQAGHWVIKGYGNWTVEERSTGATIGRVGVLNNFDWPEPELGWSLFEGAEGKGYAYEAAIAARRDAATRLGLGPLMSMIDPANARSLTLARRLGASYERDHTLFGKTVQIWRHPALEETAA
ncbi:GNAT family N-acetyltransferase [Pseudoroseicyclus aestuarii]|uniref:RimJ/RimL family protein N-acetyltransferase n=1 Tax=Pseudoroseicyclus aestuarii TaxID=1795041 RepID=A0A318SPK1_9RHOB|nr:GNAT family N-acetyltransferase [Pseudoroseicyclus aestuarii]PYE83800.1 RimJ/RimL family protein N-acetyltransferase [Pseudoroseicyclus aestuarii]